MTALSDILQVVETVTQMIDDAMDDEGIYDLYDAKYYLDQCKESIVELVDVETDEEDPLANGFVEEGVNYEDGL